MGIYAKMQERLNKLLTSADRHKPKVEAPDDMEWQPMGIEPLMEVETGLRSRSFCPRRSKFNAADRIRRALYGQTSSANLDPWDVPIDDPELDAILGPDPRRHR